MYTARTILGALVTLVAWYGTPAWAGGEATLVCGYAISMKALGGEQAYAPIAARVPPPIPAARARLRIERRDEIAAKTHLYVIALDTDEARLVAAGPATAPAELDVALPTKLVTLCAKEPIPWLAETRAGEPIASEYRRRLAELAARDRDVKPKGLGPEIHRPDYGGFQVAEQPDTPSLQAHVFALTTR